MTSQSFDQDQIVIVEFKGPDEKEDPRNWPRWQKVLLSVAVMWASLVVLADGTLFTVAHQQIADEFHIDESSFPHTYWPVTTWGLGAGLFAVVFLPLAEDFGVYPTFLISWILMILSIIPQAVARNFATLVVTRFFTGGFIAVIANSSVSVLVGLWNEKELASPIIGTWIIAYLAGGSVGPVIGSAISAHLSWRWLFKIQLIYYSIMFPFFVIVLKEVRVSAIHRTTARKLRSNGINARTRDQLESKPSSSASGVWRSIRRPVFMLCTEPVVLVSTIWSAFMLGLTYLFTQSVEQVFVGLYGWNAVQAGYVQAAIVIGEVLGVFGVFANNHLYFASARRNPECSAPIPEVRLYTAIPGGLIVTSGIFIYAWTSYAQLPWIAPAIGLAMSGFGAVVVCNSLADYMIDSYQLYAASAMGAMALGENLSIAFLPLAAQSMYNNLGFHWASSLLAFLSLALTSISVLVIMNGKRLRQRSPFIMEAYIHLQAIDTFASSRTSTKPVEEV